MTELSYIELTLHVSLSTLVESFCGNRTESECSAAIDLAWDSLDVSDLDVALAAVYTVEDGRTNPFLHLSMHLSIAEQVSIDQPSGIRQAVQLLANRLGSLHEAHHQVMECLGEMIWASQRSGLPPDGPAYIEAVRRRATARP
jgi:hypothetical protein